MKKIKFKILCLLLTILLTIPNFVISAFAEGSFSAYASAYQVNIGDTVTITMSASGTSVMPISISATNGVVVSQPNNGVADGETKTATVRATAAGNMVVTISGPASDTANPNNEYTITRYVQVTVLDSNQAGNENPGGSGGTLPNIPSETTPPLEENTNQSTQTPEVKEVEKSTNNLLASLGVDEGELFPAFDPNVTEYSIDLDYTVDTITVDASVADSKATITEGTGSHELVEGENVIVVAVRAEDGSVRNYTITVNVAAAPVVPISFNNSEYQIDSKLNDVELPASFEEVVLTISNQEVRGVKSEQYKLTLLYLNKDDESKFYIYDEVSGQVLGAFLTLDFNGKTYVVYPVDSTMQKQEGLVFGKVMIGEIEYDGWTYEDENMSDYYVLYLVNDAGEKGFYRYDTIENSMQRLADDEPFTTEVPSMTMVYIVMGVAVVLVLLNIGYFGYRAYLRRQFKNRRKLQNVEDLSNDDTITIGEDTEE